MAIVEGSVEALSRAILAEAQAEVGALIAGAQAKADTAREHAQATADSERKMILDRAHQEARRLREQGLASAQLKARTLELEHREHLLKKVFAAASERLASMPKRADYGEVVVRLVREALSELRSPTAMIRVDPGSRKYLSNGTVDKLSREMGVELTLGEELEAGTGVTVQTPDGRLKFDNTLETRLARLQGALRAAVHRVLMGESE